MMIVIVVLGALIALLGLLVAIRPDAIFGYAERYAGRPELQAFAVVIRLVLGVALVRYADRSAFPVAFQVIGWLSIAAAAALIAMGRARLQRLIRWAFGFARPWARMAGVAAMLFGAFLVYAVVQT